MELTKETVFAAAFDGADFKLANLPVEIQEQIKKLTGAKAAAAGFSNVGGNIDITDGDKAKAFIEAAFIELANSKDDDEDFGSERVARVWLKTNKDVKEAQRGDDVPMLVRDVAVRYRRFGNGKQEIFGIGLRGVTQDGKGIKLTLNRQYLAKIIHGDRNAKLTDDEIVAWGTKTLKGKWCVLGTLISLKGETGYFTNNLNDLEQEALDAVTNKDDIRRNAVGAYGFIHQMDGIRYNLAGVCDSEEAEQYQAAFAKNEEAVAARRLASEKGKGEQEGLAYSMHAKLQSLANMLDAKLITKKEYDTMRTKITEAGL